MKKLLTALLILFLATPCFGSQRLNSPEYRKFYARLNSNTSDYSGHGVADGTFTGEAYTTMPNGQTAANFDGTDDKIAYGSVSTGIKSVSFWCRPNTTTEQFMELASGIDVDVAAGTIGTTGWTSPTVYVDGQISSTLVADQWQFVTVTSATAVNANATNLGVETTNFGDTDLAEVSFYNVVLTMDEIQQIYEYNTPKLSAQSQPYDQIPDVSDSTLKGAWLNRAVVGGDDLSSNNENITATLNGMTWLSSGAEFDGSTSYMIGVDNLDLGAGDFTVSFTVNFDTFDNFDFIVAKYQGGGVGWYIATGDPTAGGGASNEDILFKYGDGSFETIETVDNSLDAGIWYKVDVVHDADGNDVIYIDGIANITASATAYNTDGTGVLQMGSFGGSQYYLDGSIKDVRIYSEAKTADWIAKEYAKAVPDDSLVLHVTDGTVDHSRYRHTLTNSGAILGDGMEFDGTDDYLTCGTVVTGISSGLTLSGWINVPTISGVEYLFNSTVAAGGNNGLGIRTDGSGQIEFLKTNSASIGTSTSTITAGKWEHVVFTLTSAGAYTFYLNGSDAGGSGTTALTFSYGTNVIGDQDDNPTSPFNGTIDNLKIFNEAKSADEAKTLYEREKKYF